MSFGEKLKEIRKRMGLTQEQLAEIMNVSRQAITKWESDLGLPDTDNLKELSQIFGITIDYLLNNDRTLPLLVMRKQLNKDDYKNNRFSYEDVLKKYYTDPYKIYILTREKKMNKLEAIFDFFIGSGTVQLADALGNMSPYYLVKKDNIKLLVNISNGVLEVKELDSNINENKFVIGKDKFHKNQQLILK